MCPSHSGLPIFEKATVEENDDLQQLWANLLTNALGGCLFAFVEEERRVDVFRFDFRDNSDLH
jgi:hypothetical protein